MRSSRELARPPRIEPPRSSAAVCASIRPGTAQCALQLVAATRSFITIDLDAASVGTSACAGLLTGPRDRAEIFLDQRPRLGGVDVAGQHQHGVVGAVFVDEPLLHVGQAGGVQVGHRTDRVVVIGMAFGKQVGEHFIVDQSARPIVALALLVLDDADLVVSFSWSIAASR